MNIDELINASNAFIIMLLIVIFFTIITILFYNRLDKYEPEKLSRILFAFFLGIISVIPAIIISEFVAIFISSILINSIFGAPIVEEMCKAWFVVYLSRNKDFDGVLDGLIYGAMVGAGFASAENLLYGISQSSNGAYSAGVLLTFTRSLSQIIGHPLYTGLSGAGIGAYKRGMEKGKYNQLWRAMLLHGTWNSAAFLPELAFYIGILIVIIVSIVVLWYEIRLAVLLDKTAFESGYYERKNKIRHGQQNYLDYIHYITSPEEKLNQYSDIYYNETRNNDLFTINNSENLSSKDLKSDDKDNQKYDHNE